MGSIVNQVVDTVKRNTGLGQVIGAVHDGIGGLFKGPEGADTSGLQALQDAALGMYGEGSADYAAQKDNRSAFGNQLADKALGKAPSIAEAQMKQAQDRNLAQQLAAAKGNRAVNPALAFRQTQRLGAEGNQQIAQASGIARMQEQNLNQQGYQNYLNNIQSNRVNAIGAGTGAAKANVDAQNQANANQNSFTGNMLGTAAQVGGMMLMSDENQKMNVQSGSGDTKSFLDALASKKYNYKNPELPGADKGTFVSVMAQDLEKAGPVGQQMVQETPNGKMVDYGKGFGAMLAAQADLNKRMKKLEKKV